jgi:hypothetical protein
MGDYSAFTQTQSSVAMPQTQYNQNTESKRSNVRRVPRSVVSHKNVGDMEKGEDGNMYVVQQTNKNQCGKTWVMLPQNQQQSALQTYQQAQMNSQAVVIPQQQQHQQQLVQTQIPFGPQAFAHQGQQPFQQQTGQSLQQTFQSAFQNSFRNQEQSPYVLQQQYGFLQQPLQSFQPTPPSTNNNSFMQANTFAASNNPFAVETNQNSLANQPMSLNPFNPFSIRPQPVTNTGFVSVRFEQPNYIKCDKDGDVVMRSPSGDLLGQPCCAEPHINMSHKEFILRKQQRAVL